MSLAGAVGAWAVEVGRVAVQPDRKRPWLQVIGWPDLGVAHTALAPCPRFSLRKRGAIGRSLLDGQRLDVRHHRADVGISWGEIVEFVQEAVDSERLEAVVGSHRGKNIT